ncbi:MAG TPA: Cro/CI family transcriptional regulator [Halothiobacillus sp.]|nr:Cro/CI family transcriptional regulator [Halothiobacillus sp.]
MRTKEAIEFFSGTTKAGAPTKGGGVKALADALGIWPHVIYRWGDTPPLARQYEIEVKTGGKLKADR